MPAWITPQLTQLVREAPAGDDWAHEIKLDGFRIHARIDRGRVQLLTRTGLDWSAKYPRTVEALQALKVKQAYLDGELCGVREDGTTSFALIQAATDGGSTAALAYFAFDLLHLDGRNTAAWPLLERKAELQGVLAGAPGSLQFSEHVIGNGGQFHRHACKMKLEGIVSKRIDRPYAPGDRGIWRKTKCLNREEFVVVGWTEPEGSRPYLGALLLGYYTPDGKLIYAGRAGTGISETELRALWERLQPLAVAKMPLAAPPPRESRFGSPLQLSRVHWVQPEMVVEVTFLTWTADGLLRQVVYQGVREDKPASEVSRPVPIG
ncbi:MAG: non-homologous end-joining DNA ligase [Alphaproteobacteria bacterium]|nr:non-homologous end-joining DNA ligase [Alphaproteobacteria bacterium]